MDEHKQGPEGVDASARLLEVISELDELLSYEDKPVDEGTAKVAQDAVAKIAERLARERAERDALRAGEEQPPASGAGDDGAGEPEEQVDAQSAPATGAPLSETADETTVSGAEPVAEGGLEPRVSEEEPLNEPVEAGGGSIASEAQGRADDGADRAGADAAQVEAEGAEAQEAEVAPASFGGLDARAAADEASEVVLTGPEDDASAPAEHNFKTIGQKTYSCPNCGQPVLFSDSHCLECGQGLENVRNHLVACLVCDTVLLDTAKFCKRCGTQMTSVTTRPLSGVDFGADDIANSPRGRYYASALCPACGYELVDGDTFCRNCGRSVTTAAAGE